MGAFLLGFLFMVGAVLVVFSRIYDFLGGWVGVVALFIASAVLLWQLWGWRRK
jgi:hypothetical protein